MKILLLLLFLFSCAHKSEQKSGPSSSILANENLSFSTHPSKTKLHLAKCYSGRDDDFYYETKKQFTKDSKNFDYWIEISNCLLFKENWREARFYLGIASELAKSNKEKAIVKNNLGVLFLKLGKLGASFDHFDEAQELDSQLVTPKYNLIQIYLSQNMSQDAMKILSQSPFKDSADLEVKHFRAMAHLQNGEFSQSAIILNSFSQKYFERPEFGLTYAQLLFAQGKPQAALDVLDKIKGLKFSMHKRLFERIRFDSKAALVANKAKKP